MIGEDNGTPDLEREEEDILQLLFVYDDGWCVLILCAPFVISVSTMGPSVYRSVVLVIKSYVVQF